MLVLSKERNRLNESFSPEDGNRFLRLVLSKGPNRVGDFFFSPEDGNRFLRLALSKRPNRVGDSSPEDENRFLGLALSKRSKRVGVAFPLPEEENILENKFLRLTFF
jgi:hypothetical protein